MRKTVRVLVSLLMLPVATVSADGAPGLAGWMGQMQVYLHKLDLSAQAGNEELLGFYLHELEETAETIAQEVPSYDGFPVGDLTASMLLPRIEALEEAGDNEARQAALAALIDSCNACHTATDHGYIRMTPATSNPFNQDFSPDL